MYVSFRAEGARFFAGLDEKVRKKSSKKKFVGSCYFAQMHGTRNKLSIASGLRRSNRWVLVSAIAFK